MRRKDEDSPLVDSMSRMKLTDKVDERLGQSRVLLRRAMDMAFGAYIEQETFKYDQWRRESYECSQG